MGGDPLAQLREQVQTVISQIQGLSQQYPMAQQQFELATKALLGGVVTVIKGTQAEPMAPPMGV
jgi:outer membrane protein TolC